MSRLALAAIALVLLIPGGTAAQDGKRELRYKFTKGEKVLMTLTQKMNVRLDEVPETFQGIVPEEPFDIDFAGDIDFEVKDVSTQGTATLEGRFPKIKAKGAFLGQDFAFDYDRARDGDKPKSEDGEEGDGAGDPGFPGMGNPMDLLRHLATDVIKIEMDARGKIKVASSDSTDLAAQLLDIGGLLGVLPKDKVGQGDTWKNSENLSLPGLQMLVMKVNSENTYRKIDKIEGEECAVVESKFKIVSEEGDGKDDEELPIPIKAKFSGEGNGMMAFALGPSRPVKNEGKLAVKMSILFSNPQDGNDIEIKGVFKLEQSLGMKK